MRGEQLPFAFLVLVLLCTALYLFAVLIAGTPHDAPPLGAF